MLHDFDPEVLATTTLDVILSAHPAQLSVDETIRQVATDPSAFSERDAIGNAIHDLMGDGLIHRNGDFVFATRAAVRSRELDY